MFVTFRIYNADQLLSSTNIVDLERHRNLFLLKRIIVLLHVVR